MQEQWQRIGGLDCLVRQAKPHSQEKKSGAIVLCHGFGANAYDLASLTSYLDKHSRWTWVFPSAPLSLASLGFGSEARAWFPIDSQALEAQSRTGRAFAWSEQLPEGLLRASSGLGETLASLSAEHSKLCVGGFSQGAMVALDTYLRSQAFLQGKAQGNVEALLLFSGTLLAKTQWEALAQQSQSCPFFLSHGVSDPILPVQLAHELYALLASAGWQGEKHIFSGAHEIPVGIIQAASGFLDKHLG